MASKEQLQAALVAKDEADRAAQLEKDRLMQEEKERIENLLASYQKAVELLHEKIAGLVEGLGIVVTKSTVTVPVGAGSVTCIETVLTRGEQIIYFKPQAIGNPGDVGKNGMIGSVKISARIPPEFFSYTLCLTSIKENGAGEWWLHHRDELNRLNEYTFDDSRCYDVLKHLFTD